MKRFITLLTLALAVVAGQAQLVTLAPVVIAPSGTSNVTQGVVTIDCRGQQNVAIKWTTKLAGAGTELQGLRFQPSADGSVLPTTPTASLGYVVANAANGATAVIVTTNFATLGYPFLHLYYATNGNATYHSTNTLEYWVSKTGAK